MKRTRNWITFQVEQLVVRGAHYRLLLIAAALGLASLVAGVLVLQLGGGFSDPAEAVWWAFLRLTDPGYLGDDEGMLRRIVSTTLTVLGMVLFMGSLIAVMTQWLNQKMAVMARGLTPIAKRDHVIILGWSNRTPMIVRDLLQSPERVRRFLSRVGTRSLFVVMLVEEVTVALADELRERLGRLWQPRRLILRSGTPLRIEHLRRVDYTRAAAILIPGTDFAEEGVDAVDAQTIKALLSVGRQERSEEGERRPLVVAEILDERRQQAARGAYDGPLELLSSGTVIGRLLAQTIRHPGISPVVNELLSSGEGNEIYIREIPELAGRRLHGLDAAFVSAVPLGVVRKQGADLKAILAPPESFTIDPGDGLVMLAPNYEATLPGSGSNLPPDRRGLSDPGSASETESGGERRQRRRVLVLGWNHKAPALIAELARYPEGSFTVTAASQVPVPVRAERLKQFGMDQTRIGLQQVEADYTMPNELRELAPCSFSSVVILASERMESGDEADARSVLAHLLIWELFKSVQRRPSVAIELMDPENARLLRELNGDVLVSPVALSHILAQIALRRELSVVFDVLFGAEGAELAFRSAETYGLAGRRLCFWQVQAAVAGQGELALGLQLARGKSTGGNVLLNPSREQQWQLTAGDAVVVLSSED